MVLSLVLLWPLLSSLLVHGLQVPLSNDHHVLHAPKTSFQPGILRRMYGQSEIEIDDIVERAESAGLDIWQISHTHVDLYISGSHDHIDHPLFKSNTSYTDHIVSESLLESQYNNAYTSESWNLSSLTNSTFHSGYHPLSEIEEFVKELVNLYPELVKVHGIGHSAEGREMFALELSTSKSFDGENKKGRKHQMAKKMGFVLTGAQHAREWIATSTAMYLVHALVANASEPHSLSPLLNHFDFHVILVPNPDGYVYTWEQDRFWYKNRQIVGPNEKCIGVDMNRNWGYKWKAKVPPTFKKPSSSADPCSHWYPGHRPFESPEVNNIANYVTTLPNLRAFVDLRSYGQMISAPFSYSCKKTPKDAEDQIEAALGAASAIKSVHGTIFSTGTLCKMLYRAPGNAIDYMFSKAGIKYSYAAHLRDTGTYGFVLPPQWIRPVGEETVNGIRSLAGFMSGRKF